jgi:threonine dehydratase
VNMELGLEDVKKAQALLKKHIKYTQVDKSHSATQALGAPVYFKLENEQYTGSFKIRGALNKISNLTAEEKARGVIACSAGNHAQGVAKSASMFGVPATIVMPESAPLIKVSATKGYGADVVLFGESFEEAKDHAHQLEKERNLVFVHPFEDPYVIAGQGTIGLELLDQIPDVDTIVVPVGGGGLISGISLVAKAINPKVRIIGVQSSQAPGMNELYHSGVMAKRVGRALTIADGIAVKYPSKTMYESFIKKYVDDIVTVSDSEIAEAIVFLIERVKTVAEGSGAAALAAGLGGKVTLGKSNCFFISGGNIDLNVISRVIEKGLLAKGRISHITLLVADLPGHLNRVTQIIAENGANVLDVYHDRLSAGVFLKETRIDLVFETTGHDQIRRIKEAFKTAGMKVI